MQKSRTSWNVWFGSSRWSNPCRKYIVGDRAVYKQNTIEQLNCPRNQALNGNFLGLHDFLRFVTFSSYYNNHYYYYRLSIVSYFIIVISIPSLYYLVILYHFVARLFKIVIDAINHLWYNIGITIGFIARKRWLRIQRHRIFVKWSTAYIVIVTQHIVYLWNKYCIYLSNKYFVYLSNKYTWTNNRLESTYTLRTLPEQKESAKLALVVQISLHHRMSTGTGTNSVLTNPPHHRGVQQYRCECDVSPLPYVATGV